MEIARDQQKKPFSELPKSLRGLVACRVCASVKTVDQFLNNGCIACYEDITNGRAATKEYFSDQHKMLQEIVTPNFEGVVCVMDTSRSWVARWQGCSTLRPGAYAQKVNEEPGPNLRQDLEERNVDWITKSHSVPAALLEQ